MVADGGGTPLATHLESASPAEVKLVETTMAKVSVSSTDGRSNVRSLGF